MWQTLVNAFKDKSLRIKIFITLGLLLVYRIGCYIPVPGLNFASVQQAVTGNNNTLLQIMNVVCTRHLAFYQQFHYYAAVDPDNSSPREDE